MISVSFEIKERDLLARIGELQTKSGVIETPALLPVINPVVQSIAPLDMWNKFRCEAVIANAYAIKKNFEREIIRRGIHKFLDFPGIVMTDSGAYQILVYGAVETTPEDIVKFQEQIGTDIGVILDVPTGWDANRERAGWTVKETLRRAKLTLNMLTRDDILWVGPVQGGRHLDLIKKSAEEMRRLPYPIYALGSPTQVMERYLFDKLVDMIMTAKMSLSLEKPLHLFGAGHPFMFALVVAMGCDLFDSAAYALYARKKRYMTDYGTIRFERLKQLPCSCPICSKYLVEELRELRSDELERALAEHNLYACQAEMRRIKLAVSEGRLWELVELRARSHPALLRGLYQLKHYAEYIEKHSPTTKKRGIFYFGSTGLYRPEVIGYARRIRANYFPPAGAKILLLLPQTTVKPFHNSYWFIAAWQKIVEKIGRDALKLHVCFYAVPFGVVPIELDEVYPITQSDFASLDSETTTYVTDQLQNYILEKKYAAVILHNDPSIWKTNVAKACRKACKELTIPFAVSSKEADPWGDQALTELIETTKRILTYFKGKKLCRST